MVKSARITPILADHGGTNIFSCWFFRIALDSK